MWDFRDVYVVHPQGIWDGLPLSIQEVGADIAVLESYEFAKDQAVTLVEEMARYFINRFGVEYVELNNKALPYHVQVSGAPGEYYYEVDIVQRQILE